MRIFPVNQYGRVNLMSYRVLQVLLYMTLASSAAVRADESGSATDISGAFNTKNDNKGLAVSERLTLPTYNPANSPSDTKTIMSPSDIKQDKKDIKADKKDISQDDHQLATEEKKLGADIAQLIKDLQENKPASVIKAEEAKINEEEADIKASNKDIKADKTDLTADQKDLTQDKKGH
jgi:hypothetical protein